MKKIKIIGIILLMIISCYIVFIMVEINRFSNHLGIKPLIIIDLADVNAEVDSNIKREKITGLGYTVNYRYIVFQDENSDNQINKVISGEFKLFDKFILGAWME